MKRKKGIGVSKRTAIITFAILISTALIVGGAGLLQYYGKIEAKASVQQAVTVDGNNYENPISHEFDVTGGCCKCFEHTIENQGCSEAPISIDTSVDGHGQGTDGVDTSYFVKYDAGADFSDYEVIEKCDISPPSPTGVIVLSDNGVEDGDTVCISSGTYDMTGNFKIDVPNVTIVSKDGQGAATINTQDNRIHITADGVTIKGFEITTDGSHMIYAGTGVTGLTLESNKLVDKSGDPANWYGFRIDQGTATVRNNVFDGFKTGVHLATSSDSVVEHNHFLGGYAEEAGKKKGTGVKITAKDSDISNIVVKKNLIKNQGGSWSDPVEGQTAGVAVQEIGNTISDIMITENNFKNNYMDVIANDPEAWGDGTWNSPDVVAINNWWGCDGIQVSENVYATWNEWDDTIILQPGETLDFTILYCFDIAIKPGQYDITTKVVPTTG